MSAIRLAYQPFLDDRYRIRAIMNGGEAGLKALLGNKVNLQTTDLPALNTFLSGVTRLGHTLGKIPDVKADPSPTARGLTKEDQQEKADKRGRIVRNYDALRLTKQMRQHSRWLPGYGYAVWVCTEHEDYEGNLYPIAESRDPMNTYPGFWSHTEDPSEMITTRYVPEDIMLERYGISATGSFGQIQIAGQNYGQSAYTTGVEVIEYFDEGHTYLYVPSADRIINQSENPLTSGPKFVVAQRTSFDQMRGQYDDAIGLLAFMAKLSVLSLIATEDAVFRETNIYGGFRNVRYKRGRYAVNHFPRDAKVDKPGSDIPQIAFQQIDRVERSLRTATQYPVSEDGIAPMSFVTGEGISRLNQPTDRTVEEYQDIFKEAIEKLDTRRLEWDTKMYPTHEKPMHSMVAGIGYDEKYTPKTDIGHNFRTRREFGVMAGLDDPTKIVASLQLYQAGVVDLDFVRENIRGLGDLDRLRDGSRRDRAESALYGALEQQAAQGDPRALMALTEIFIDPDQAGETMRKFHTPEEPEMSPEEQLMAQGLDPNAPQGPIGPPPDAQTVLTQLGQGGNIQGGGVQTVGRIP
jgi:hypothetical protein